MSAPGARYVSEKDEERGDLNDVSYHLIPSASLIAVVTLNTAERMALDGYLCVLRDENQVYARIDRMGNRDPRVITY